MIADLIVVLIFSLFALCILLGLATVLTWVERKLSALMADRIGANRCYVKIPGTNIKFILMGLIHSAADGLKMMSKERFVANTSDKFIYLLAPWIVFAPVMLVFAVVPFGGIIKPSELLSFSPTLAELFEGKSYLMQIAPLDGAMLAVLAISGISIIGVIMAGWSSNNKYSLLGGVRAASQMISYEITLGLALIPMALLYGTLDLHEAVVAQSTTLFGFLPAWGIFQAPLAALLYLVSAIAENKRLPFDLPEAESELIVGYFTEYSGMRLALFMFAEFIEIAIIAAVFVTFFLGGYNLPYSDGEFMNPIVAFFAWPTIFFIKVFIVCCFQILVRWTLPRFRYDQLMVLGWKYLIPLGMINLVGVATYLWLRGL